MKPSSLNAAHSTTLSSTAPATGANWKTSFLSRRGQVYVCLIFLAAILVTNKGISDEATVALNGDMPKYMMNGVYFYDFVRDFPLANFVDYTMHYFARYPNLSLGHHPLLPAIALVPFYSIFGISVFSARITILLFIIVGGFFWFFLIRKIFDDNLALFSTLLFITSPYVVKMSRIVMSEMIALTLIIISTYFLYIFTKKEQKKHAIAFIITSVLSIYAKQTALLMFPFYALFICTNMGIRRLFKKDLIMYFIIIFLLISPVIPITLKFSQHNVNNISKTSLTQVFKQQLPENVLWYKVYRRFYLVLQSIWKQHLTKPVFFLSLISIFLSLYRKDKRGLDFLLWIVIFYLPTAYFGLFFGPRYTIYLVPPFCLFAAASVNFFSHRLWRVAASTLLIFIILYQFASAFKTNTEYARGYEEAAKYIVENNSGDSVLYCSRVDTGYFIFFVRKYDNDKSSIILRADKILATSAMARIIDDRISSREQIFDVLDTFGVKYVVIEELKYNFKPLRWLTEEVKTQKFLLRKRIPVDSNVKPLQNAFLAIYEYKEYSRAKDDAILLMNIPLMGDQIKLPFKDLLRSRKP